jgi:hypothetical protein
MFSAGAERRSLSILTARSAIGILSNITYKWSSGEKERNISERWKGSSAVGGHLPFLLLHTRIAKRTDTHKILMMDNVHFVRCVLVLTCKLWPTLAIVNKSITSILGTQENSFSLMGSDKVEFFVRRPPNWKTCPDVKAFCYNHNHTLTVHAAKYAVQTCIFKSVLSPRYKVTINAENRFTAHCAHLGTIL